MYEAVNMLVHIKWSNTLISSLKETYQPTRSNNNLANINHIQNPSTQPQTQPVIHLTFIVTFACQIKQLMADSGESERAAFIQHIATEGRIIDRKHTSSCLDSSQRRYYDSRGSSLNIYHTLVLPSAVCSLVFCLSDCWLCPILVTVILKKRTPSLVRKYFTFIV